MNSRIRPALSLDEALTPQWLTAALRERYPGVVVARVDVTQLLHGVGTKALLSLTYGADRAYGLPTEVCLKAGYEEHNAFILRGGAYLTEAHFYSDIADDLSIVTPRCFYAGCDEATKQGVLILEDLNVSRVVFGSAKRGYTADEAARFLDSLAALHARYWDKRSSTVHPWLGTTVGMVESTKYPLYTDQLQPNLDAERGAPLPTEMRSAANLIRSVTVMGDLIPAQRASLAHGDPHPGNLYLTRDGSPGFFDWQTLQDSSWAIDVPYFICAALSHADRHASMEDLLRHYLDRLATHGATPPTWNEAWLSFRQFLLYGFYNWAITRTVVQPAEVINAIVDRLGNAAAEVESFKALGLRA